MVSRTQYIATETAVSIVINGALSVGFVFLVFHGMSKVAVGGRHGIILDMAPQTFMVTLMACLVPALLTRSRQHSGRLAWHTGTTKALLSRIWIRAFGAALLTTFVVVGLSAAAFPHLFADGVGFGALVIGKAIFGMILAAVVTPWAITRVLR